MTSDRVLLQGLDLGDGHSLAAKPSQSMFEQAAAQPLAAMLGGHRQVVDPTDPRLALEVESDVSDRPFGSDLLGNRHLGAAGDVDIEVPRLPPPPVAGGHRAEE